MPHPLRILKREDKMKNKSCAWVFHRNRKLENASNENYFYLTFYEISMKKPLKI